MALVEIPDDEPIHDELHDRPLAQYPWAVDRDTDTWAVTPHTWRGEPVLVPFASNMRPATRASVEATYGPLVDEPHCTVCGSTDIPPDGTCTRALDTIAHPNR